LRERAGVRVKLTRTGCSPRSDNAPTILFDALQTIRRRVKSLSVLFGIGVVIASAIAALIVTVLLDYVLISPVLRAW
jgi:hypothetical protein